MTQTAKLIGVLLSGRRLTHREARQLLEALGYTCRQGRGSGIKFVKPGKPPIAYHVPHNGSKSLKPYVLDAIIEAVRKEL